MNKSTTGAELTTSENHTRAVNLNQRIITASQLAQQNLFDMISALKEMRDGKLYKEFGYSNFEDYCEAEVNMSRANAHKYIAALETFGENVKDMQHLGTTKLYLLAKLSEEERADLTDNAEIESMSVRELERQIKELKTAKEVLGKNCESAKDKASKLETQKNELSKRIEELETEIEELHTRPIEVAVQTPSEEERHLKEKNEALNSELSELKAELDALKNTQKDDSEPMQMLEQDTEIKARFKACFIAAYDATDRLLSFVKEQKKDFYTEKTAAFIEALKSSLEG